MCELAKDRGLDSATLRVMPPPSLVMSISTSSVNTAASPSQSLVSIMRK